MAEVRNWLVTRQKVKPSTTNAPSTFWAVEGFNNSN
jgi:hypothetical protein